MTLGYTKSQWTAYASAIANHFDSVKCSFAVKVPRGLQQFSPTDFQMFAGTFLGHARVRAGGSIGQSTELLQSQYTAGIARSWGRVSLAFDYTHAKAEFGSSIQSGYSVSGTFPVSSAMSLKLTGGATTLDPASTPYVGLYMSVDW